MRVAIDARKLQDFGIGTYIRNLLRHLARIDRENEYVLLCHEPDMGVAGTLGENFRAVLEPAPNYSMSEQVHIPWVLMREKPHVFHAPHYVLPVAVRSRSVVTIHDCIHLMFPQYLPNRAAYAYARGAMWSAARHSDRILTVSEASKRDILRFFNVRPDKISVVYNGIDERFSIEPAPDEIARVRERFQLDHGFVLYAGTIKPHKNLVRLIEAFAVLRKGELEEPGAEARRAQPQAAQACPVSRFSSRRDAGGAVPARRCIRLPVAVRGLRPAATRSHGQRHTCRHIQRVISP